MIFPNTNWIILNPTEEQRVRISILVAFKGVNIETQSFKTRVSTHPHIGCLYDHACNGSGLYNCKQGAIKIYRCTIATYEEIIEYYSKI